MKELSETLTRNCVVEKYGVIITDYLMNVFECAIFMSSTRHNVFVDDDYDEDDDAATKTKASAMVVKRLGVFIFDRHTHALAHIENVDTSWANVARENAMPCLLRQYVLTVLLLFFFFCCCFC